MRELDQRLLDGIRLTGDAYHAGRLDALREAAELLGDALKTCNDVLDTAQDPVARMKARGAHETIERILDDLERRIGTVEANRASAW